jgi:hypothetical protein
MGWGNALYAVRNEVCAEEACPITKLIFWVQAGTVECVQVPPPKDVDPKTDYRCTMECAWSVKMTCEKERPKGAKTVKEVFGVDINPSTGMPEGPIDPSTGMPRPIPNQPVKCDEMVTLTGDVTFNWVDKDEKTAHDTAREKALGQATLIASLLAEKFDCDEHCPARRATIYVSVKDAGCHKITADKPEDQDLPPGSWLCSAIGTWSFELRCEEEGKIPQ